MTKQLTMLLFAALLLLGSSLIWANESAVAGANSFDSSQLLVSSLPYKRDFENLYTLEIDEHNRCRIRMQHESSVGLELGNFFLVCTPRLVYLTRNGQYLITVANHQDGPLHALVVYDYTGRILLDYSTEDLGRYQHKSELAELNAADVRSGMGGAELADLVVTEDSFYWPPYLQLYFQERQRQVALHTPRFVLTVDLAMLTLTYKRQPLELLVGGQRPLVMITKQVEIETSNRLVELLKGQKLNPIRKIKFHDQSGRMISLDPNWARANLILDPAPQVDLRQIQDPDWNPLKASPFFFTETNHVLVVDQVAQICYSQVAPALDAELSLSWVAPENFYQTYQVKRNIVSLEANKSVAVRFEDRQFVLQPFARKEILIKAERAMFTNKKIGSFEALVTTKIIFRHRGEVPLVF